MSGVTVGVDLGGTKIQAVALDGDDVRAEAKMVTPAGEGVDAVVAAIVACVDRLGASDVTRLGLGVPGVIDATSGEVVRTPNLHGFESRVPIRSLVSDALGVDHVVLANDVNAGTIAEHQLGAGRGFDDVVGVFVGTGVGGGLVFGGRLHQGASGAAGEVGHLVVRQGGRPCGCGLDGHLEAYAGRASMEAEARRRHAAGESTVLIELAGDGRMKSSVWEKALVVGDPMAASLIDEAIDALGTALASVVDLLDVAMIVVGGGMADRLGGGFVEGVEQATRQRLFTSSSSVQVVPATLGDLAGAVGAALLARH